MRRQKRHFGNGLVGALITFCLMGMYSGQACAVEVAGELFVDLDAGTFTTGDGLWTNSGSYTNFEPVGDPTSGMIETTPAVFFDGTSAFMGLDSAPEGITGLDPTRSIEVWALNPSISQEETMVSWGHRGGPEGTNMSFNYGFRGEWGAVGHWGGGGPDLGWIDNNWTGGSPEPNHWHHLVYTYDGETTRVYSDGQLWNEENVVEQHGVFLDTYPEPPIAIASQWDDDFSLTEPIRGSLAISKVRVHDGVLTDEQIAANFSEERSLMVSPPVAPPPTPSGITADPVHRYSFDSDVSDSIGSADGTLVDNTGDAQFQDGRLVLGNTGAEFSAVEDGDYVDLPNGIISSLGSNMTLEVWTRWTGESPGWWQRVLDIGNSDNGEDTSDGAANSTYMFLTPFGGNTSTRVGYRFGPDADERILEDDATLAPGEDKLVTVVWNGDEEVASLYVDGSLVAENDTHFELSEMDDVNVWLGRSQWNDAMYVGEYDEFRIYDYALDEGQIYGNFLAGPDTINRGPSWDYNGNGVLDAEDLNLQADAIQANSQDPAFDLDQDGMVDFDDRQLFVEGPEFFNSFLGDRNLDGEFSSSDLVTTFTGGKYETGQPATWEEGDWNADGRFNSSDLVAAFSGGGYESGPRAGVRAVPEPTSAMLALAGLFGLSFIARFRLTSASR